MFIFQVYDIQFIEMLQFPALSYYTLWENFIACLIYLYFLGNIVILYSSKWLIVCKNEAAFLQTIIELCLFL